ncbi:hypothetical protein DFJ74DRAFT_650476 [Hyaloraphidium curvatum]|nr:hypothetical protein DFJ74DRAFT_650476 [Hyaloraphidium curvatum]
MRGRLRVPIAATLALLALVLFSRPARADDPPKQAAPPAAKRQQAHAHAHRHIPFEFGDELRIECVTPDANGTVYVDQFGELIYGPGPICAETGETWTFQYGYDTNLVCRWLIDSTLYQFLKMIIQGQAVYRCRLKMSKEGSIYMPYPLSIWGGVEPSHIHVMNHFSFNFHAAEGFLVGAAAYPLRDHFQLLEPGSMLTIHGPVRWFAGHSYEPLQPPPKPAVMKPAAPAPAAAQNAPPAQQPVAGQPAATTTTASVTEAKASFTPAIPLSPIPNKNELSARACVKGYGYYEPYIVTLYCFMSSVATAGICYLVYVSFIKAEAIGGGRKNK